MGVIFFFFSHPCFDPFSRQGIVDEDHLVLVAAQPKSSIDQFFELDKIVATWLLTVDSMASLSTPREKVQWIVEKVKQLDKANKLLPAINPASAGKAKRGSRPIADKVHSSLMGQLITSTDFIKLWATVAPIISQIKKGELGECLDDQISRVLGYCFSNDDEGHRWTPDLVSPMASFRLDRPATPLILH